MTSADERVPKLRNDILRRDLNYEAVLWSPIRRSPVALDAVSTVMLDVIDGEASTAALVEDIHEVVGVSREVARQQVQRTLRLFDTAGVLATAAPDPLPERQLELFINPPSS